MFTMKIEAQFSPRVQKYNIIVYWKIWVIKTQKESHYSAIDDQKPNLTGPVLLGLKEHQLKCCCVIQFIM
jgi:hypothetical protein